MQFSLGNIVSFISDKTIKVGFISVLSYDRANISTYKSFIGSYGNFTMTRGCEIHTVKYVNIKPIIINEEWLLKFGWKYLNGKTSGDLTKDTSKKMDIDFIDGKLKIKSHYEDYSFYRDLNIIHVHRLQNFFESINEPLIVSS